MPFERCDKPASKFLIIALSGKVKHGKTHFALTAPGPIAVQNLDMGLDGVVQQFQDAKVIKAAYYKGPSRVEVLKGGNTKEIIDQATDIWERFKEDYRIALSGAKTIVWDTATEAWEICRLAHLGKLTQVKSHHYSIPNSDFRDQVRLAEEHKVNLVLTHRVKKEYVGENWSGGWERSGFADIGSWAHVVARMDRRVVEGVQEFHLVVDDCRQNTKLNGLDLPESMANFPALARLVFPGTTAEEWGG